MSNKIQNLLSDEQLNNISGGCCSKECGDSYKRDNDCGDSWKKDCGEHHKPRRDYDDCRPSYRPHRCG